MIVLPVEATPATLEACGRRGIKAVVIISGGFKETGTAGQNAEEKCLAIAKQYGIRLIGPNCVGLINLHNGLNTTFINGCRMREGLAFSHNRVRCAAVWSTL